VVPGTRCVVRVYHRFRHVPIDILPRDVLTFRTVCNQDVTENEHTHNEPTDCTSCRPFERGSGASSDS
jgi:hypothetical protein